MAPSKAPLKSYSRRTPAKGNKLDVLHNILSKPIRREKQGRKLKLEIKELPPRTTQTCLSGSESSLKLNVKENTFDRLLNATDYNRVNFKHVSNRIDSSESSLSMLVIKPRCTPRRRKRRAILQIRSPILTRSFSMKSFTSSNEEYTETEGSSFVIKVKSRCRPMRRKRRKAAQYRSPIITRSLSLSHTNSSLNDEDKKVRTLDKTVNESLCVEKVKPLVREPTPDFLHSESHRSNSTSERIREGANESSITRPIFSKTFVEKYNKPNMRSPFLSLAMSSTPMMIPVMNEITNESIISPIVHVDSRNKIEGNTTPQLKRVSKTRRSILLASTDYDQSSDIKENSNEKGGGNRNGNEIESTIDKGDDNIKNVNNGEVDGDVNGVGKDRKSNSDDQGESPRYPSQLSDVSPIDRTDDTDLNGKASDKLESDYKSGREESSIIIIDDTPLILTKDEVLNTIREESSARDDSIPTAEIEDKEGNWTDRMITFEPSVSEEIDSLPVASEIVEKRSEAKSDKVVIKPGKLWRRSLLQMRNTNIGLPSVRRSLICVASKGDGVCGCVHCKKKIIENSTTRRLSVRVVPLQAEKEQHRRKRTSILESYATTYRKSYLSNAIQESLLEESFENLSLTAAREKSILRPVEEVYPSLQEVTVTARDVVLRKCEQTEPLPFEKCYPNSILQHCQKIGEGVYGEVFLFRRPTGGTSVIKVIPIEGSLIVNNERQKKFEEILSEITIAMELSALRCNAKNNTNGFSELRNVTCVKGKYPERLQELWELYDEARGSENDHPGIFEDDQLYVVLELANGGKDMESFIFRNAQQAYALVTQVACALAVAESSLQFEHRDLHWGNILIENVNNDDTVSFCLNGKNVTLETHGVQIAIIDFTLSRISYDGVCIYNDLALDPDLFTASGDYQFEIYRSMQNKNGSDWQHFEPYTNILWLHYVLDKSLEALRYQNNRTKIHKKYLRQLKELKDEVLLYKSAEDFVYAKFI